jgi:hypothetical protein
VYDTRERQETNENFGQHSGSKCRTGISNGVATVDPNTFSRIDRMGKPVDRSWRTNEFPTFIQNLYSQGGATLK